MYGGGIYSKYWVVWHYVTLLEDLRMHVHKVVSRCYTEPLA